MDTSSCSKLNWKIVFILETDGDTTSTYMATSDVPDDVQIVEMPRNSSPSNHDDSKIGIVQLASVLKIISKSSPEITSNNPMENGFDYNIYYKDISEHEEPFVTLGLLSPILNKIKDSKDNTISISKGSESILLLGRIKKDMKQFLRQKLGTSTNNESNEFLEIRMKFSRVMHTAVSKKSNTQESTLQTDYLQPKEPATVTSKRITNPRPAPRAVRTQSLPVWNPKINNSNNQGLGLPINSLAHKIYMADRQTDQNSNFPQKVAYHITTLKENNTLQNQILNDVVQKRFDFIKQKRKHKTTRTSAHVKGRCESNITQKNADDSTSSDISTKYSSKKGNEVASQTPVNKKVTKKANSKTKLTKKVPQKTSLIKVALHTKDLEVVEPNKNLSELQPILNKSSQQSNSNKENIPPNLGLPIREFDLNSFQIYTNKNDNDMEWLMGNNYFEDHFIGNDLESLLKEGNILNENITNIANQKSQHDKYEGYKNKNEDNDRTSPIDTLSMPLMELNQKNEFHIATSCQEQLKKLPIFNTKKNELEKNSGKIYIEYADDDDRTSVVDLSSSSSREELSKPIDKYGGEEVSKAFRNRGMMPSSPAIMTIYEGSFSDNETNEEFSTLINQKIRESPNSHYTSQSSEPNKPK